MAKNNFSRSNVNESTLQISAPNRSSFDLSENIYGSFKFGCFTPVRCVPMMPTDTFRGSLKPQLTIEKIAVPSVGRMRLDTHTFFVSCRRINNQWRQWIQSVQNRGTPMVLPSFSIVDVTKFLWQQIFLGIPSQPTVIFSTMADLYSELYSSSISSVHKNPVDFCISLLNYVIFNINQHVLGMTDDALMYHKDFLKEEVKRLRDYLNLLTADAFAVTPYTQFGKPTDAVITRTMYELCKTFMGEGSILDWLGYDVASWHSPFVQRLASAEKTVYLYAMVQGGSTDPDAIMNNTDDLDEMFSATPGFGSLVLEKMFVVKSWVPASNFTYIEPRLQNEMFLRAQYAAWYDYMRNYHLEKSSVFLNPDNFSNNTLFGLTAAPLCLLTLKFRTYGRDMFTTVQPDDVYRHVASPIRDCTYDMMEDSLAREAGSGSINTDIAYDSIFGVDNSDVQQLMGKFFPSGLFSRWTDGYDSNSYYMNDLQTMRRAGMLEKYLARNYYNPDTYAGYIEAHYGVKPVDFAVLCSEYLGGDESFITGNQEINPTTTAQSDAGTRTMVADASLTDSFSYNTTEPGYLISFVSIVPLVVYDKRNPHLSELTPLDMPLPEFAEDTRIMVRTCDLLRGYDDKQTSLLGYVPRYLAYRSSLDSAHGKYLYDYRSYIWLRDRYQDNNTNEASAETLNIYSLRVHMPLDGFIGLKPWDDIAYGKIENQLSVDRPLPAAIEFI